MAKKKKKFERGKIGLKEIEAEFRKSLDEDAFGLCPIGIAMVNAEGTVKGIVRKVRDKVDPGSKFTVKAQPANSGRGFTMVIRGSLLVMEALRVAGIIHDGDQIAVLKKE